MRSGFVLCEMQVGSVLVEFSGWPEWREAGQLMLWEVALFCVRCRLVPCWWSFSGARLHVETPGRWRGWRRGFVRF